MSQGTHLATTGTHASVGDTTLHDSIFTISIGYVLPLFVCICILLAVSILLVSLTFSLRAVLNRHPDHPCVNLLTNIMGHLDCIVFEIFLTSLSMHCQHNIFIFLIVGPILQNPHSMYGFKNWCKCHINFLLLLGLCFPPCRVLFIVIAIVFLDVNECCGGSPSKCNADETCINSLGGYSCLHTSRVYVPEERVLGTPTYAKNRLTIRTVSNNRLFSMIFLWKILI